MNEGNCMGQMKMGDTVPDHRFLLIRIFLFSMKTFVVGTHWTHLNEMLLMSSHNKYNNGKENIAILGCFIKVFRDILDMLEKCLLKNV